MRILALENIFRHGSYQSLKPRPANVAMINIIRIITATIPPLSTKVIVISSSDLLQERIYILVQVRALSVGNLVDLPSVHIFRFASFFEQTIAYACKMVLCISFGKFDLAYLQ